MSALIADGVTDSATEIPSQRLSPKSHLARAAKSPVGSDAEQYHLQAAEAEALTRLLDAVERLDDHLATLVAFVKCWLKEHPA